ncbi:MAG: magnesium chelatase [Desulfuromonas sp.]|nr:MAG: magnesium chelatase [Desulfuromonas sp.]
MKTTHFPFSAIVGQDAMKTALLLNAVDPGIGGVLIRGQKGTAKSTAVRALAALLPEIEVVAGCAYHCPPEKPEQMHDGCYARFSKGEALATTKIPTPMVELPLGATEDRVVGSLHLEQTLKSGERSFEPGLLAAANRGILYVDEVNLLEDHLVDLLLDAAASGVNRVEREGLCVIHPARFMLIGTMNPEEGELRPQFLDRFGLSVSVDGLGEVAQRRALLENRFAYERDPQGFVARWAAEDALLARRIRAAQQALESIEIPAEALDMVVKLALDLKVQGHRADITLLKVARAMAALLEKERVGAAEIAEAAWFVLPHRLPGGLFMAAADVEKTLKTALEKRQDDGSEPAGEMLVDEFDDWDDDFEFPGAAAAGSMLFETFKKKALSGSST